MATKKEIVEIHQLELEKIPLRIVGDTPLICHAWSPKARAEMLATQTKKTKTKSKEIRNPVEEFINSMYWLTDMPEENTEESFQEKINAGAKFGFPVGGIKQSANSAAYRLGWVKNQAILRGAFFLQSEYGTMAEIKGDPPIMREDMVRLGGVSRSADLRYRGAFNNWYIDLILEVNKSGVITIEQLINNINAGGYVVGIGEWRPEKDGDFGKFHVEAI